MKGSLSQSNSFTLDNIHSNAENDFLQTFERTGRLCSEASVIYLNGKLPLPAIRVSSIFGEDAEFIATIHSFKTSLCFLHLKHFHKPFQKTYQVWEQFFKICRHCVNREDWPLLGDLSIVVMDWKKFWEDSRTTTLSSYAFDSKLTDFYDKIHDSLCNNIRKAVVQREMEIEDGIAKPILSQAGFQMAEAPKQIVYAQNICIQGAFDTHKTAATTTREDVVNLVREIATDNKSLPRPSYPAAVRFIRHEVTANSHYYQRSLSARQFAQKAAKPSKDGEEKFWRSVAKEAQPSYERRRMRGVRRGPPGPVPILDRDAEHLADSLMD